MENKRFVITIEIDADDKMVISNADMPFSYRILGGSKRVLSSPYEDSSIDSQRMRKWLSIMACHAMYIKKLYDIDSQSVE